MVIRSGDHLHRQGVTGAQQNMCPPASPSPRGPPAKARMDRHLGDKTENSAFRWGSVSWRRGWGCEVRTRGRFRAGLMAFRGSF